MATQDTELLNQQRQSADHIIVNNKDEPEPTIIRITTTPPPQKDKPTLSSKLKAMVPTFAQSRKTIKSSIALALAIIVNIHPTTRLALGEGALLVSIVMVFYFPSKTIGVQTEAVVYGTFGALVGAAWCFLGMYLGNLARDKSNPVPVQPGCSAVLAVFMFIATFVINYVRIKLPKANFACINACIQTTMALTQASIIPGFYPLLIWTFLKPIALAGGLSLAVNYLIWPDDSVTNYMLTLKKTLLDCKTFVKEHSDAFLATSIGELETTLPTILSKIQGDVLMLIDSKRAVQREIVYSRLSAQDLSNVTRIVKGLRPTIHGIGLSWVLKKKYYSEKQDNENENLDAEFEKLLQSIQSMQPACESLVDASQKALTQCIDSLDHFHRFVRTTLNSILWPFPRFFYSGNIKARKQQHIEMTTPSTCPSEKLQQSINQFDEMAGDRLEYFRNIYRGGSSSEHRSLYLIYLYQYNIRENALCTLKLIKYMEELEQTRPGRRLWFPHMTIKKWFQSPDVDANIGGDANNYGEMNQQQGMTLVRTATRQDLTVSSANGEKRSVTKKVNGRVYVRDADVEAPTTIRERFFYWTQSVSDWLFETDTVFAFKTAAGVVFGAIPCYMASQASWYFAWHGQWALITLVLWMTPMTGMFNFSLALKIIGTILGGILGIVIWEITQGNPYGLVVVCFIVFLPLYHIFFYGSTLRIVALMTKVTMILILVYEYDFHHFNPANMDPVWTLAGKRVLLVLIGIVASYILMIIPYPVIGRVELRKRLSQTIYDIEKSYGIVNATLMRASRGKARTEAQEKSFRQFSLAIRRQIEDERMFLLLSAFEPPLRGKFPKDSYAKILGSVDNMSGLIQGMSHSARNVDPAWRVIVADTLIQERKDYLTSIITTLKLTSSALATKLPLPPFMVSPGEARIRFKTALEEKIQKGAPDVSPEAFSGFSAYMLNSNTFLEELQTLLKSVEDLVGIDDPNEWLDSHA